MNENSEKTIQTNNINKKASSKSKNCLKIILFFITVILIATITLSVILILPLLEKNPLKNTLDTLFFDTDILSETLSSIKTTGYENNITLHIPAGLAESNQDINLEISEHGIDSGDNQKKNINVKLDSEQNSYEFDVMYDNEKLSLQGLSFDKDLIITFPRRDIVDALDKSVFAHYSRSKYALSQKEYDELRNSVEILDLNTQEQFSKELTALIENTIEKSKDIFQPINSYYLAQDKFMLCRTTEIKLNEDDLKKLADIIYAEFGACPTIEDYLYQKAKAETGTHIDFNAEFDKFKEKLTGAEVTISYTVANRMLVEFSIITVSKEDKKTITNDFRFIFNGETENPEFKIEFETAEQGTKITERYNRVAEYKKISNENELSIDFSLVSSSVRERPGDDIRPEDKIYSAKLTYDKSNNYYSLEYSDNDGTERFSANGNFEFDATDDNIYLSIDEIVENDSSLINKTILEFSLKPDKLADKITVPQGTDFLGMEDQELEEFIKNFNIIELDRTVADITGESLGIVYTIDERLLLNASAVISRAQTYATYYQRYISNGNYEKSIYIFDEEYDMIIMFDYIKSQKLIQINFAYELTSEIELYYREASISGSSIRVH